MPTSHVGYSVRGVQSQGVAGLQGKVCPLPRPVRRTLPLDRLLPFAWPKAKSLGLLWFHGMTDETV